MESPSEHNKFDNEALSTTTTLQSRTPCDELQHASLDTPDTFRMSLDYVSMIGENVVVGDMSIESPNVGPNDSQTLTIDSQNIEPTCSQVHSTDLPMPQTPQRPGRKSPPILETPKLGSDEKVKPQHLLKLSLTKLNDGVFVKPSPLAELMSPAKMLQFEIDIATSSTPTMKRAAIDFNFFNENNFEEYFIDVPKDIAKANLKTEGEAFIETPVIVKTNTIRHEIGYVHCNATVQFNTRYPTFIPDKDA